MPLSLNIAAMSALPFLSSPSALPAGASFAAVASCIGMAAGFNTVFQVDVSLRYALLLRSTPSALPAFSDPRVNRLYASISAEGIFEESFVGHIKEIFGYHGPKLKQVVSLLRADAHLSADIARDVAEATDRFLIKAPPRADKNADIILRYEEFKRQGATQETWDAYYNSTREGALLEFSRTAFLRPYAVEFSLRVPKAMWRDLSYEAFKTLPQHQLVSLVDEIFELFDTDLDGLFMDFLEEASKPHRRAVLAAIGATYTPGALMKEGAAISLADDDAFFVTVLRALVSLLLDPSQKNKQQLIPHIVALGLHYAQRFPHFREHLAGLREHQPPEDGGWDEEKARKFYEHAKELSVHGIPEYFSAVAMATAAEAFGPLKDTGVEFQTALTSFGKYFEEIDVPGEAYDMVSVPVKGLAAAVAIDSGSDCGKGKATARALGATNTVSLFTDPKRTKLWGYHELYEVESDQGLLLQSDAMNPSTQLDLKGDAFLKQMQLGFQAMRDRSRETGEEIRAFLISSFPGKVSNRTSIERAAGQLTSLPKSTDVFSGVMVRGEKNLDDLVQELIEATADYDELMSVLNRKITTLFSKYLRIAKRLNVERRSPEFIHEKNETLLTYQEIFDLQKRKGGTFEWLMPQGFFSKNEAPWCEADMRAFASTISLQDKVRGLWQELGPLIEKIEDLERDLGKMDEMEEDVLFADGAS